jgi:hypothetical protein
MGEGCGFRGAYEREGFWDRDGEEGDELEMTRKG